jgi:hypothetical protein
MQAPRPAVVPAYGPPPRFRQTIAEVVKPSWLARLAGFFRRRQRGT